MSQHQLTPVVGTDGQWGVQAFVVVVCCLLFAGLMMCCCLERVGGSGP